LRQLARSGAPGSYTREIVPETVQRIVESLPNPAYITNRRWDILAWNAAAAAVFTAFVQLPEADRNVLVYMFTNAEARRIFGATWSDEAQRMVAQFRAIHDLWAGEPAFDDLVARLRTNSAEFRGWWKRHEVRTSAAGRKVLDHPRRGKVSLLYATFQSNDSPGLKLVIYAPARRAPGGQVATSRRRPNK
jgi:hypothetical protein